MGPSPNKSLYPASFTIQGIDHELGRLTDTFGGAPRVYPSSEGVIATWGGIQLQPLNRNDLNLLSKGENPNLGFLIDYRMDFHDSARAGLPVYSLSGGKGFVWIARFQKDGTPGKLRFLAADPSQMNLVGLHPSEPWNSPSGRVPPSTSQIQIEQEITKQLQAQAKIAEAEAERVKAEAEKAKAEAMQVRPLAGERGQSEPEPPIASSSDSSRPWCGSDTPPDSCGKTQSQSSDNGDEDTFISAVVRSREAYQAAANDLAKGGTRAMRKKEICAVLHSMSVQQWKGTIAKLSSNSEGKGVLYVKIAPDVQLTTWNNRISDMSDDTLIEPSSSLFQTLSHLKTGDAVTISGSFVQADQDCVKESSMTLSGSMLSPDFVFRFSEVTPRQ